MQGDLTNPAYFDFISFAQLGTISAALDKPRNVFQARLPFTTSSRVTTTLHCSIKRSPLCETKLTHVHIFIGLQQKSAE